MTHHRPLSITRTEELNSSHKRLAPLTAKKSPKAEQTSQPPPPPAAKIEQHEQADSNEDESNMSSASSNCDQSQSGNMSMANASAPAMAQTGAKSKKRGRPRLYEINPSTGKSMKGIRGGIDIKATSTLFELSTT